MPALNHHCHDALMQAEQRQQRRLLPAVKTGIDFCSNDYFALSQHPQVIYAGVEALQTYGTGSRASRLVNGNHPLYAPLEAALAKAKKRDAALVFGSGYLANLGMISSLMGRDDIIFADKLVHHCMISGAQLSGAKLVRFQHNDQDSLQRLLAKHRAEGRNGMILTESIFSMDGDAAPLAEISVLAKKYDAWLVADDAHGLGFVNIPDDADIIIGTLSKGLGAMGGYVAGSQTLIDFLTTRAGSFIYTTALPPSVLATAHRALEILMAEPERAQRVQHHMQLLCTALNIPTPPAAIVPMILGDEQAALDAAHALASKGLHVSAIRPPTVSAGTARLRITLNSAHTDAEIDQLISALKNL